MNLRLLAAAAAVTAFGIAGAQAQQPSPYGQTQQNDSVRGSAGASGSAHTQKVHPRGSAKGTVGAAPGRGNVDAGAAGSMDAAPPPAGINGAPRPGGPMR
ncbi:hypothetical protein [Nitrobacter winogradskyi]|uniref:Uncharacterized protein n=2 Tax=Nitrobacter winogradskyi TaxID=913 RepID=A0ACC6AFD1_NITWI|nr:hypothetical protein [Nitrobacter winogradskyi]MCP1997922.1 hypothetical protein [Nitrobacter winogradskyi]GEC16952.1 hypothetical protein NWI01_28440 [Nitrobacter winogradskyi]